MYTGSISQFRISYNQAEKQYQVTVFKWGKVAPITILTDATRVAYFIHHITDLDWSVVGVITAKNTLVVVYMYNMETY